MHAVVRSAVFALLLALGSESALALVIRGSQSCADWTKESKAQKPGADRPWLLGYLSGLASGMDREFWGARNLESAKLDSATVYAWMDKYCSANPQKNIVHGADLLFKERTGLLPEAK